MIQKSLTALASSIIELKNIGILDESLIDALNEKIQSPWLISQLESFFGISLRKIIEESVDSIQKFNPLLTKVNLNLQFTFSMLKLWFKN